MASITLKSRFCTKNPGLCLFRNRRGEEKVTLFKGAVSGERVGAAHRPVCGARPAAMATGAREAKGAEMPLKEALRFARSSSYRSDLLPGPGDHTWRRSAARGPVPRGMGQSALLWCSASCFSLAKCAVFYLLKKEIENTPSPQCSVGAGQPGPEKQGRPCPGGHTHSDLRPAVRPPTCPRSVGGRVSESHSALGAKAE